MSERRSGLLRWAGSKRHLLPLLETRVPSAPGRYFEPFAGSACLFFRSRPPRAVLGDLNAALLGTYRTVRHRPEAVATAMVAWRPDADMYYEVRALDPSRLNAVTRAARFVYLNRLCFNGVYRTNREGHFNVPYGRNTGRLPAREDFVACSTALRGVELRAGDFAATTADAHCGDVAYLDPPYTQHPEAAYGVYGYGAFQAADVERLVAHLDALDDRDVAVVLSYADTPHLRETLDDRWSVETVRGYSQVAASTRARRRRHEVLVTNVRARDLMAAQR